MESGIVVGEHTTIEEVREFMIEFMKKEHLGTFADRMLLVQEELGGMAQAYLHDVKVNPKARPIEGNMKAEMGDAFMMLFSVCEVLKIDPMEVFCLGLERLKNKEYMDTKHQVEESEEWKKKKFKERD